jgi:hypothetical protein
MNKSMGMNKNMKRNKRKSIKSSMIDQDKDIQTRDNIKDKEEIDNTIDGND